MKRYLPFVIIAGVLAGAIIAGTMMVRTAKTTSTPASTPEPSQTPVVSQTILPGTETSKNEVLIEEFGDYQCPPCGALHPELKKLKGEFGSKIKFVFHHFPLTRIHKNAAIAAFAAAAAAQQGKFMEMHNLLYESQEVWAETDNFAPILVNFARQLGLNMEQFEHDINDSKVKGTVLADVQLGESRGVTGTPTLFIDGQIIEGEKLETANLRKEINNRLKAKSQMANSAPSTPGSN
jgi:protein-disulfide isomerase